MSVQFPPGSGNVIAKGAVATGAATALAAPVGSLTVSPTLYNIITLALGMIGVIVARMVYIDQENKRLGRKQTIGETLPLTIVALLIAMPFVWKHREEITIAPLIGLGVGYSALLLLKLIGRATIVAARTMAQEVALSLSDTPVPRKRDADPDDQRRIENAMARLHEIDHDDGGGKAP